MRCNETTQSILRQRFELQNFIQTHCQIRTYSFQVCNLVSISINLLTQIALLTLILIDQKMW